MPDLLQSAKLFEVSTRLQTASSCVNRFAKGTKLSPQEKNAFKWAGNFLAHVDWTSEIQAESGEEGGLTVSASNARPKFYASLFKIGPKLQQVGIDSEEKVHQFLKAVYQLLMSGGTQTTDIPSERLELVGELLHILSLNIMVELSNNMLPRRRTLLSVGESF
ncbi:MAG: hypothetical protein KAV87_45100 [Desulfobacteraceae bacterium]|nr:hypothetical protein [Desulfobacteraceae bacterium]